MAPRSYSKVAKVPRRRKYLQAPNNSASFFLRLNEVPEDHLCEKPQIANFYQLSKVLVCMFPDLTNVHELVSVHVTDP